MVICVKRIWVQLNKRQKSSIGFYNSEYCSYCHLINESQQRAQLQQTLEQAKAQKNKQDIHATIAELKLVNELRKSLFEDRDNVKQQLNELLEKVQQLNNRTKELKELIKNRCGKGGQLWYQRLEAKKQQKRLAKTA